MTNEERCRADIIEVGRRLHERAYVASNDGNISVRLGDDRLLTTPKGVSKGFMTPDMLVVTDLEGRKQDGERDPRRKSRCTWPCIGIVPKLPRSCTRIRLWRPDSRSRVFRSIERCWPRS